MLSIIVIITLFGILSFPVLAMISYGIVATETLFDGEL